MPSFNTVTVTDVNRYVKSIIAAEDILYGMHIQGEISNFVHHLKSGHFYFTLKDAKSSIKCVMFHSHASKVLFVPENGMKIIATGDVQVFERDGIYQVYCTGLQPDGLGAYYLAYEQLKKRLEEEGLFDEQHKRVLPAYPKKIGVITSKTGAAFQDIIHVLSRRYPIGQVVLFPTLVQGQSAPQSICNSLARAEKTDGLDVIILGRGGGSIEDLWAFNDEAVARAIFHCPVPVISAVGHEIDFTIADFAADLRAPTPSAAAELVAPDADALLDTLNNNQTLLYHCALQGIQDKRQKADALFHAVQSFAPDLAVKHSKKTLESLHSRLDLSFQSLCSAKEQRFSSAAHMLDSLSPLKVLTRGYSITFHKDGTVIRSVKKLKEGAVVQTRLQDGLVTSIVTCCEER